MTEIYNKTEAAKKLKISVETINRHMKSGKLPCHKIGDSVRFTEDDINAFLALTAKKANETSGGLKMAIKERTAYLKGRQVENYGGNCGYCGAELNERNQVSVKSSNGGVYIYSVCTKCTGKFNAENRTQKQSQTPSALPPTGKRLCGERLRFVNGQAVKVCSSCKRELSAENFSANISSKDGLRTWCKVCQNKQAKQNREKNADKFRALKKKVDALENNVDMVFQKTNLILDKISALEKMWA